MKPYTVIDSVDWGNTYILAKTCEDIPQLLVFNINNFDNKIYLPYFEEARINYLPQGSTYLSEFLDRDIITVGNFVFDTNLNRIKYSEEEYNTFFKNALMHDMYWMR